MIIRRYYKEDHDLKHKTSDIIKGDYKWCERFLSINLCNRSHRRKRNNIGTIHRS
jgi:hypothetical protein